MLLAWCGVPLRDPPVKAKGRGGKYKGLLTLSPDEYLLSSYYVSGTELEPGDSEDGKRD